MAYYSCPVNVMRSADENELASTDSTTLVPGDVIEIPQGSVMPCDLVLLTGQVIMNESMLTGESTPVIKNQLPCSSSEIYRADGGDSRFTLYGGTKVV